MAAPERDHLLERDQEVAALAALVDTAAAGAGGVAVIEGPAGIGKTRLLAVAHRHAASRATAVFRARGSDLEGDFAYGIVRQLFEAVLARSGSERQALLSGSAGHAAAVFAAPDPVVREPGVGPTPVAQDHGLFWLVANLAKRSPLLVSIDDAQWADEASLRFLHYLARRAEELPVALVVASRGDPTAPGTELVTRIASEAAATVLTLHALSRSAARDLVRSLLSDTVDERVCAACYAATGGNPLLLRELAGALNETGVPATEAALDGVGRLVPEAVARHVLVRLARRPHGNRRLRERLR